MSESDSESDASCVVELDLQKDGHISGTAKSGIDLSFQSSSNLFSSCPSFGKIDRQILDAMKRDANTLFFR